MGCNKLNTYDWLKDMVYPHNHVPFNIVEIRFKGSRKEFFRNGDNLDLYSGDAVVLESDLGHDIGHVSLSGELVRLQLKKNGLDEKSEGIRKIYRVASERDVTVYDEMKAREPSVLERARTIAMQMNLEMKISDIEFQGDGKKVIFFYTSEGRVDFRELIKRYASEFKTRIEMRQVGYREEASRLGGIGSCGRVLCCSTWLTDYKIVNVSAAKNQNLSINMLKLSGQCGRLKCCLNYELDSYLEALSEFPRNENVKLETKVGVAYLQKTDILKRLCWFAYGGSTDWVMLDLDRVNEIVKLNAKGTIPETLIDKPYVEEVYISPSNPADLIGDDSLTRLDKPKNRGDNRGGGGKKKFNKNKNRNFNNRPPRKP
jgi:cell fate regulator YaaT (PSP1 superfamily)